MRIGLIDVDGHNFPNIALMKISAYHKAHGNTVEWYSPLFNCDKVYMSKVFSFTDDYVGCVCENIERGGVGYDKTKKLPVEIETQYPDYSLYKVKDTAYGYLTRGCLRQCPFCIVSELEGIKSLKVSDVSQFWNGQKYIKLLDPNLLASPDSLDLLKQLKATGAYIDFTQGVDARLLNNDNIRLLSEIKIKRIHFAWDDIAQENLILPNLIRYKKASGFSYQKLGVYVLCNFNSTIEQDLYRINKLRAIGFNPYVMIFEKHTAKKEIRHLQRWCNNRFIFRTEPDFYKYRKGVKYENSYQAKI